MCRRRGRERKGKRRTCVKGGEEREGMKRRRRRRSKKRTCVEGGGRREGGVGGG